MQLLSSRVITMKSWLWSSTWIFFMCRKESASRAICLSVNKKNKKWNTSRIVFHLSLSRCLGQFYYQELIDLLFSIPIYNVSEENAEVEIFLRVHWWKMFLLPKACLQYVKMKNQRSKFLLKHFRPWFCIRVSFKECFEKSFFIS